MSNCPHCGLFRYDLSGCICSDQEYNNDWNRRAIDEIFSSENKFLRAPKKLKRPKNLQNPTDL
ncbi:hypothetical protein ACFQ4X_16260 [Fictibacillus halophilus]|uniref:hypothetical protein n=1 Tax=Fictibacillus halophilus TaxID=1610490 RepID=UPI00363DE801